MTPTGLRARAQRRWFGALLWSIGIGLTLSAASQAQPAFAASAQSLEVGKRTVRAIPFADQPGKSAAPRIDRPFFDGAGQLHWFDSPVHIEATGACDTQPPQLNSNGLPIYPRQTKLLGPRVDERLCSQTGKPTEIDLIGFNNNGKKSWQRRAVFQSGAHPIDQRLIGASADGLVLSALEVWSAQTGATIMPAATRAIPAESRTVPLHSHWGAALFHPARQTYYVFEANVTLTTRQGGLYEINPANGAKTLLHRVVTTLLGGFDRIEEMVLTPDRRYLVLAQRLSWRGPTDVSLALVELTTNRLVFHERFCRPSNDICADPHVVVSAKGAIGFSYTNLNRREHQLLLYELKQ